MSSVQVANNFRLRRTFGRIKKIVDALGNAREGGEFGEQKHEYVPFGILRGKDFRFCVINVSSHDEHSCCTSWLGLA